MAQASTARKQFNLKLTQVELDKLKSLSDERHVPMGNIIRFALERLYEQLDGGQLNLPLGLQNSETRNGL